METIVSSAIIDSYFHKLKTHLDVDTVIVGGGPSGLIAAYYLATNNKKVALLERKPAPGGGMWGGAMMFNQIVVQKETKHLLEEFGISYKTHDSSHYVIDSIEATASLIYHASKAGAAIFNCFSVEDVIFKDARVSGVVVNWGPVHAQNMYIDPLTIKAKTVLESTGHPCEVASLVARKNGVKLDTITGGVVGEMSLAMEEAEITTVENTRQIFPGLYVSGMAANGVHGGYRMGPIFGGMLLSGEKVANLIIQDLS